MTGFEPGSSGIGSDHAINCATSTAQNKSSLLAQQHEHHSSKTSSASFFIIIFVGVVGDVDGGGTSPRNSSRQASHKTFGSATLGADHGADVINKF